MPVLFFFKLLHYIIYTDLFTLILYLTILKSVSKFICDILQETTYTVSLDKSITDEKENLATVGFQLDLASDYFKGILRILRSFAHNINPRKRKYQEMQ